MCNTCDFLSELCQRRAGIVMSLCRACDAFSLRVTPHVTLHVTLRDYT